MGVNLWQLNKYMIMYVFMCMPKETQRQTLQINGIWETLSCWLLKLRIIITIYDIYPS